ncbi:glycosyltransferase family 2 protein [Hymenobacter sp. BT635]|uniref:Glycosyltransferase family 2 protein n=1 Tax=Hymenobacter nitidus TaxID=2880929 RepID=A0ABS8AH10_9BACT|nr:glycosyltransferase [Hymenobacter nitidus]MCB2379725.1 glycosyltransferase family 2 protein [Hymenobacter nitidus]
MKIAPQERGITVLICTYNSAARITETLQALAQQKIPAATFGVEVILVDNASSDATSQVAATTFEQLNFPFPYQILYEGKSGKSNALELGFATARYEYVCIVDDDNWLQENYLALAWEVMEQDPQIGALGGIGRPECEIQPPSWFKDFAAIYAADKQATHQGDITAGPSYVYGAGCVVRKEAWEKIYKAGFKSMLTGRHGDKLSSGEDNEMCYAFVLAGYKIWYDERLRFQHFIPAKRLTWDYVERIFAGNAESEAALRPYIDYIAALHRSTQAQKSFIWLRNAKYSLQYTLSFLGKTLRNREFFREGETSAIRAGYYWQQFKALVKKEVSGDKSYDEVQAFIGRLRALDK